MILVELVDVGINRFDVLAQPLSLSQKTSRCVKRPDYQRPPLLEVAKNFNRDSIDRALNSTDEFSAIAANRRQSAQASSPWERSTRTPAERRA